ncbi:pyridoxamine 5'-phosphate oxidase [Guyanagaster necrorhizus]|uniref:pyridoxal 5'-phosphate synthase n=1 Tax=Guyanagaster necrorhizus TaxID=856835 RepID=A0A9P7VM98_9AGAR|nr:pyridoxamine 5'-phosphate oxidase [Guyanagaster necrorhizus MCA 3950]KAG7442935.1 pyridoxamine 5'-phosphate oxidase [Guyanagaster necrorhizus MCA 3950]
MFLPTSLTTVESESTMVQVIGRNQYNATESLSPQSVDSDPLQQFKAWFSQVSSESSLVSEPESMVLSTCTLSGVPSSRQVLLKQVDNQGFVFYTNYTSRKSLELGANPNCALVFYWREAHWSVRVVGRAERVSREETEAYFRSRPRESQLGAWASKQSSVVREGEVTARLEELKVRFEGKEVDVPDFWGGWRVLPSEIEFWSGRPSRLHDRVRYLRKDGGEWNVERLAP